MCLYPRLIKNKKYMPTKKNNYNPPKLIHEECMYVAIGCGNCIECREQKAREWQTRLAEEIKIHAYNYFITLTFSNDALDDLCNELKTSECNAIAGLAIRRFLERWRKKYKKSVKHWLIDELGHQNTERLHLHGLLFLDRELTIDELTDLWKYGKTDTGQYVNNRTINYIVKYITKIDHDHKGFKAQIFCSAGLGRNYIRENIVNIHRYNGDKTKETYTLNNGRETALPIYYRNKLFTEEERELLWRDKIAKQITYVRGLKCRLKTNEDIEEYLRILKAQQETNKKLGYGDFSKEWSKKEYNTKLQNLNYKSNEKKEKTIT